MKNRVSRRDFLKASSLTAVGFWVTAGTALKVRASANEQITVAGVGVGGKGWGDIENASRWGKVVAVCDVDRKRGAHAQSQFEGSNVYTDYRKMFDEMEKNIDAVTVSTADHTHAAISLLAMQLGKHVYTQKPLTRTIFEARQMGNVAREKNLCTQMGNQGSAERKLRLAAMQLKTGAVGMAQEIHVWTDRPIWPQGVERETMQTFSERVRRENPEKAENQIQEMQKQITGDLENLDWESWIGVGKFCDYFPGQYHDFKWRGWWDFGTGALGDIGCHSMNMAFVGLNLRNPTSIIAKTSGHHFDSFPRQSEVTWEFPTLGDRAPLTFKWYDGGLKPDAEFLKKYGINPENTNGSLIVGNKGYMVGTELVDGISSEHIHYPEPTESEFGGDAAHSLEWGNAIRDGKPENCWSNFPNVAGPLTEMILAGNLAVWAADKPNERGPKIEWDAEKMRITNHVNVLGLEELIRPTYRLQKNENKR